MANQSIFGYDSQTGVTSTPVGSDEALDVNVTQTVPGTGATSLGKAEDSAHSSGDTGVEMLAVRRDTAAVGSGTDGDYSTLNVDSSGKLWAKAEVDGDIAHDAVDSGNPVKIGGKASTSEPTAVADADRVDAYFDENGRLHIVGKSYDTASDTNKTTRQDPEWSHYVSESFTMTNVVNATPEYVYIDMEGYTGCSIHIEDTGGVDTFVATFESSNEGSASTDDWIDTTTNGWTEATAGGSATDSIWHTNKGFRAKAQRLKITTAGGGNDADFAIFVYRW